MASTKPARSPGGETRSTSWLPSRGPGSPFHVVGDADDVVPPSENTAVLASRFRALGGHIRVIEKKGVGHHPHGPQDVEPVVDFILEHTRA
jgi:pimeloyl-ACP methyl ester carboxylesterase